MIDSYLERAREQISDPKLLAIAASKRARELARGRKPMIRTNDKEHIDVALLEIAEGLIKVGRKK